MKTEGQNRVTDKATAGHGKRLAAYALALGLTGLQPALQVAQAADMASHAATSSAEQPSGIEMAADAVVARPLLAATTVLGTAVFLVTLPLSALGGNAGQAADELVTKPAKATFMRCLGCTR